MRMRGWIGLLVLVLMALPVRAQETRGNINGVVQDTGGVIPGAVVRITNTNTSQTQQLTTNSSGYFEAILLNPGTYSVRVELQGYKVLEQQGISLSVGQTVNLNLRMEVGQLSEQITVVGEAPLLDASTVSSGQNFDRRMVEGLPAFSSMPITLSRFTPGVAPANTEVQNIFQGYMEGTSSAAGGQVGGGTGLDDRNSGNNYTIDGAVNNGFGRRIANSPNSDQIEEVRVETSNFDASQGYGTGLTVAMMTRAGTNALHATANYSHWNNEFNSPNLQQKVTFKQNPQQEDVWRTGRSHIGQFTLGGPIVVPKLVDGRNKAFFFFNFSKSTDSAPGRLAGNSTVPANRQHLDGDFSDLLLLPSGAGANTPAGHHQYQIFDPLTARPDPNRPGRVIRDPFPNNIIPKDRFMNPDGSYKSPLFALYQGMVPEPNQNFISPTQQPTNNYYRAAEPDQPNNTQVSMRVDYNVSESDRLFVRYNANKFLESSLSDWTYDSPDPSLVGLHDVARSRYTWSLTGTWTKVLGATVIDTQLAANRANQRDTRKNMVNYRPTMVGLPAYMDDFCTARYECILPQVNIGGYQGFGGTVDEGIWVTNYQGQSNLTHLRGSHTLRAGVDVRWAQRTALDGAGNMGTFTFNNQYTRAADDTGVYPAQNIGLSLASLMLGMPTSASISDNNGFDVRNQWMGTFVQDTWRLTRNLTLNLGLRFEYENGIKEAENRNLPWFNPDADVTIAGIAEAAYAASPIPGLPASAFQIQGGSVYAGTQGYGDRTWAPEALWMPRASFGYRLGSKNVVKGGYGMFFDTLNARAYTPNREGFNATTNSDASDDLGLTWEMGDPVNGISPLVDPFPVQADGSRYLSPYGSLLGADAVVGSGFTADNPDRKHARVQRWRLGWQHELASRTMVEVAYSGSYGDRQGIQIRGDYVPEQYYATGNVRDNSANEFLTGNVPNPFHISKFASLQATNPELYAEMAGNSFFTAQNVQRQRLLREFPHMNNLQFRDLPLGIVKAHSLELIATQRYSNGLSGHVAMTMNRVTENRTVEEYDREPTLWQTNNSGRPWRLAGAAVYELPFGPGKPFLENPGVLSYVARGWAIGATAEYQPGAVLQWNNNLFYNGNLSDIAKDSPEIALQPDGTFDPTKTWFNTEGFVTATGDQPAAFQKRAFPFRVDGVRGFSLSYVNMNVSRTFALGGRRTFQFRTEVQNLFNRQHFSNPEMNPTNTNFGQVRGVTNDVMRFITFNFRLAF